MSAETVTITKDEYDALRDAAIAAVVKLAQERVSEGVQYEWWAGLRQHYASSLVASSRTTAIVDAVLAEIAARELVVPSPQPAAREIENGHLNDVAYAVTCSYGFVPRSIRYRAAQVACEVVEAWADEREPSENAAPVAAVSPLPETEQTP